MHKKIVQSIGVALVLVVLFFPLFIICFKKNAFKTFVLNENIPAVARPSTLVKGFFERESQPFFEQAFLQKITGLRSFLILSYNELIHDLFHINSQKTYIRSSKFGYYPLDTVTRINHDVIYADATRAHFQRAAHRVRVMQDFFAHDGVALVVVPTPSKVQVYPEYVASYLVAPPDTTLATAPKYAAILEENGVNTFNVQRFFSERKSNSEWPFFTNTSFHWSFWAGCLATQQIINKAETLTGKPFFKINCSNISYENAQWQDRDIAEILNLYDKEAIITKAPFPVIPSASEPVRDYKIAIIGDSFSEHIMYVLTQAFPKASWRPDWLTFYSYFRSRLTIMLGGDKVTTPFNKDTVLSELLNKELLILEVYDGAVVRNPNGIYDMEFSATAFLLDKFLPPLMDGPVNPNHMLTQGWKFTTDEQWHTTTQSASLVVRRPLSEALTPSAALTLVLNVDSLSDKPNTVRFLIDGQYQQQFNIQPGRQILRLTVPNTIQTAKSDSLFSDVTLSSKNQSLDMVLHDITLANTGNTRQPDKDILQPPTADATDVHATTAHIKKGANLLSQSFYTQLDFDGLGSLEGNGKKAWRWGMGPQTTLRFYMDPSLPESDRNLVLKFALKREFLSKQRISIFLNGKEICHLSNKALRAHESIAKNIPVTLQPGVNIVEFKYHDWNHRGAQTSTADPRKLAVLFEKLVLQPSKLQVASAEENSPARDLKGEK